MAEGSKSAERSQSAEPDRVVPWLPLTPIDITVLTGVALAVTALMLVAVASINESLSHPLDASQAWNDIETLQREIAVQLFLANLRHRLLQSTMVAALLSASGVVLLAQHALRHKIGRSSSR